EGGTGSPTGGEPAPRPACTWGMPRIVVGLAALVTLAAGCTSGGAGAPAATPAVASATPSVAPPSGGVSLDGRLVFSIDDDIWTMDLDGSHRAQVTRLRGLQFD